MSTCIVSWILHWQFLIKSYPGGAKSLSFLHPGPPGCTSLYHLKGYLVPSESAPNPGSSAPGTAPAGSPPSTVVSRLTISMSSGEPFPRFFWKQSRKSGCKGIIPSAMVLLGPIPRKSALDTCICEKKRILRPYTGRKR